MSRHQLPTVAGAVIPCGCRRPQAAEQRGLTDRPSCQAETSDGQTDDAQANGCGLMIDAIPRSARANLCTTLAQQCAAAGGQAQSGRAHGFSRSYVSELLSGRKDISDGVAIRHFAVREVGDG